MTICWAGQSQKLHRQEAPADSFAFSDFYCPRELWREGEEDLECPVFFPARSETEALSDLIINMKKELSGLKTLCSSSVFGGHVVYSRAFLNL